MASAERWHTELRMAEREDKDFIKAGKKIVKRYRDSRTSRTSGERRYNVLWANIQTLMPALYGKTPKAQVERRNKDQDPVGRTASLIMERALQYEIDEYGDYDLANKAALTDRLLAGRGVAWVRLETRDIKTAQGMKPYECAAVDYVYWEDFRHSPARTWDEVTWIARVTYLTKADGKKRFGDDFKAVPLSHVPQGVEEASKQGNGELDSMKKAKVWEIWDKPTKKVTWVAEGYDNILDEKDDLYGLDNFWPCPTPLYATQTTDTLVPVPDFSLYQDQAEEIDSLTQRIGMLVSALKVVGVYDSSQPAIARMLDEAISNQMIPVDSWAAFSEKGGIKGTVDFMPLDMVVAALNQCYISREHAKETIYEITGLSDIIRGASVASETATAQNIKSKYASLRLTHTQAQVAKFASDILRIKAQIMCDFYSPENLVAMSGIMQTADAQYAEQAVQLIKSEPARNFQIQVASDSLVEMDEQEEKRSRTEFMTAFGSVLRDALPMVQQAPEMGVLVGEVLTFVVRTFKSGRQLENVLEGTIQKMNEAAKQPKPQAPDPEQIKAQAAMQLEQARGQSAAQIEQIKTQSQGQLEQLKTQNAVEIKQLEQAHELAMQNSKQAHEKILKEVELLSKAQLEKEKSELDNATRIEVANISAKTAIDTASMSAKTAAANEVTTELDDEGNEVEKADPMQQVLAMHGELMQGMSGLMQHLNKPKVRTIQRGKDGRAIAMIETTENDQ